MQEWSQWSTTGWAPRCGNYCCESSRFTAEVRKDFSRDPGWRLSGENVIHSADWLHSCRGHDMILWGNWRCELNNIHLACRLFSFSIKKGVFLTRMQNFSEEMLKRGWDSRGQLSVINIPPQINKGKSSFPFGWDLGHFTAVHHQGATEKKFKHFSF